MHFALSTINHDGNEYFRGDSIPELSEKQAERLIALGVLAMAKPEDSAPVSEVSRVLADEERRANRKDSAIKTPKATQAPKTPKATQAPKTPKATQAPKHADPNTL